ncbi:MAG TPA: sigma-70 family RNA polymerase sigma factor [Niabella sp.]|nr:sigma-70 family RNA polymerase sigma factor [Niabella sp.]HOZ95839.1 sigma-70 family RNA polymerase sigma factor [Niabella sp.]HQW13693.1 sigma-70 family RNA polymerase sigma factor [Niabella sp.]HQX19087.1 sigma-70 family RNA polymerase sigma factor [Niabella sp.]HQX42793.1 sigma-70 family RNA polymerase sigma factor [Niabella sp.]
MKDSILEQELGLLKGLARNDKKAVEMIYSQNYNLVQALVVNNSGTIDDAKDLFQEAMMVLFEKARSGNFELNCQIRTYLYSIARRLWLKKLNQGNRQAADFDDTNETMILVDDDVQEHEQKNAAFEMMHSAINNLGEPCKSLLESFYFKNKSMLDIAQDFGYTNAENAKTQKYKCLMRLKKIFFSQYKKID